jgi:hypothetical protein
MNARGFLKDVLELEERGLAGHRDKMIAAAEQRILEHKRTLHDCRDNDQILGALAGLEVCKVVIEALSKAKILH